MFPNVRAEIARKGLTLTPIAEALGITVSTLSQKLNGKYPLTLKEARTIKEFIDTDLSIEELFEEEAC